MIQPGKMKGTKKQTFHKFLYQGKPNIYHWFCLITVASFQGKFCSTGSGKVVSRVDLGGGCREVLLPPLPPRDYLGLSNTTGILPKGN